MAARFKRYMPYLLAHEGGKVDNPRDPGGRTNQGVTQRVYNGYRRRANKPLRDVYMMEPSERDAIYKLQYWSAVSADKLPDGVDYVIFDGAVNSGPVQSIKWCQRALSDAGYYTGKVDGHMGESTLSAIELHPNHDKLIEAICARRLTFLQALKTWPDFRGGWTKRIKDVKGTGMMFASGERAVPVPDFVKDGNAKGEICDAKAPMSTAPADATASGGVITTTMSTVQDVVAPIQGASDTAATIYAILAVAGAAVIAFGILWGLYVRKQRARLNDALNSETPAALGAEA